MNWCPDEPAEKLLFETGLPVRYYVPPEDVREEMLVPSEKQTLCPYKGTASYRSVRIGGDLVIKNVVWYYSEPTPDTAGIRNYLCFFNEKVDLEVDGEATHPPSLRLLV